VQPIEPSVPTVADLETPSYNGPYDEPVNGVCADGHPLNGQGRCEPLNVEAAAMVAALEEEA